VCSPQSNHQSCVPVSFTQKATHDVPIHMYLVHTHTHTHTHTGTSRHHIETHLYTPAHAPALTCLVVWVLQPARLSCLEHLLYVILQPRRDTAAWTCPQRCPGTSSPPLEGAPDFQAVLRYRRGKKGPWEATLLWGKMHSAVPQQVCEGEGCRR
jgi:hypothetical protein